MPAERDPLVGQDELARMLEANEGATAARRRPTGHGRGRSGLHVTGAVAAGALIVGSALGFGLGASVAESGNAASGPRGLGFLPASGWTVLQTGEDATRLRPVLAIASNVPFHPDDAARGISRSSGLPLATLLALPRNGVVISATFTVPNADTPDPDYPTMPLPLRLPDATRSVHFGTQIRPDRPLGTYQLRAQVEGRDVFLNFYFGKRVPTAAARAAAQRQLDLLVVEKEHETEEPARHPNPQRTHAPAGPSTPVGPAATVIDRTLSCATGIGKGVQGIQLTAISAFRSRNKLDKFGQVVVSTPGNPVPSNTQTFSPTLAGATAGWPPPPPFSSGALGFSPKLCKAIRARVPLSPRGLGVGGEASVFGEDLTCTTPKKVVIRVRAAFFGSARLALTAKKDYVNADGRIAKAQVAVRTPNGKPLAYGEVFDSGKARLFFTGRNCV
jgi:hypothetical protein